MADKLFYAAKFGILGVGCGVAAGYAANMLYDQIDRVIQNQPPSSRAASMGVQVFDFVAGATVAAGILLAGDQLVEYLGGEAQDPLFHTLYYLVGFNSMVPAARSARAVRNLLNNVPVPGSVTPSVKTSVSAPAASSCSKCK
jgi:ABC-type Fe3+ transport system permease subunit